MKQKEFWELYYKTARGRKFTTTESGLIRRNGVCPVCAVTNMVLGKRAFTLQAYRAGRKIGLDRKLIGKIMDAADNSNPHYYEKKHQRQVSERVQK